MHTGYKATLLCALLAVPLWAHAAAARVTLASAMFVEQAARDAAGRNRLTLKELTDARLGDRVVFVVNVRNDGAAPTSNIVVVNPLPAAVSLQAVGDPSTLVSSDGGRTWARFDAARTPRVTHMRWTLARRLDAGESDQIIYRGVIR